MANKRIIDVDVVSTINENDFLFINQQQSLKQIKKSDIPKPSYTADEVGALPKTKISTLSLAALETACNCTGRTKKTI